MTRAQRAPSGPGAVIFAPSSPISRIYASFAVAAGASGTAPFTTVTFRRPTTGAARVLSATTIFGAGISSSKTEARLSAGLQGADAPSSRPASSLSAAAPVAKYEGKASLNGRNSSYLVSHGRPGASEIIVSAGFLANWHITDSRVARLQTGQATPGTSSGWRLSRPWPTAWELKPRFRSSAVI